MQHAARQPTAQATPAFAPSERETVTAYYRAIAPFYDAELADRDDLDFWCAIAARHRGGRFLELGAGSGRVTEVLAPAARELVAIDVSPELLRLARRRLAAWPRTHLIQADMLEPAIREPFDLIVAANDPFSHLIEAADRDRALGVVARHLAPGGRFVLDALWVSPGEAVAMARAGGRVRRRTISLDGQRLGVVERWERPGGQSGCCHARYEYRCDGRRLVVADFEARDWSVAEMLDRLDRAGLAVARLWGSYDGHAWSPATASQLIVEAALARGERGPRGRGSAAEALA